MRGGVVLAVVAALSGCRTETPAAPAAPAAAAGAPVTAPRSTVALSAAGFATECTQASECAGVFFGNVCGCTCANSAISLSELGRYLVALQDAQATCGGDRPMCKCAAPDAVCMDGTCRMP